MHSQVILHKQLWLVEISLKPPHSLVYVSAILVLAGYYLVGNEQGLILGLMFAAISSFGSWFYSDRIALASYTAQPIERSEASELFDLIQSLSDRAGIPMPQVFVVPTQFPNAFATGRDPEHAAVADHESPIRRGLTVTFSYTPTDRRPNSALDSVGKTVTNCNRGLVHAGR